MLFDGTAQTLREGGLRFIDLDHFKPISDNYRIEWIRSPSVSSRRSKPPISTPRCNGAQGISFRRREVGAIEKMGDRTID